MKKLIIFLSLSLFSCGNLKKIDCWVPTRTERYPYNDTVVIYEIHHHYIDEIGFPNCVYIPTDSIAYTDTLVATFYKLEKRRPCKCF